MTINIIINLGDFFFSETSSNKEKKNPEHKVININGAIVWGQTITDDVTAGNK